MEREANLKNLIEILLTYITFLKEKFNEIKKEGKREDFYTVVQPIANEIKIYNDKWKQEAMDWLILNTPKQIHQNQIETTYDHIEIISIQAFFPETSRNRFNNYIKSTQYVLQTMLNYLK